METSHPTPFAPSDWRRVPDHDGEIWMRQCAPGSALTVASWSDVSPWKLEGVAWNWCVSTADDPRDFDPRFDWGGAETMDQAKAAAEATWAEGPV